MAALRLSQMADICKLAELACTAKADGYPLRMPSDFPKTLRRALFRAATSACVDALDHDDQRWARFQPGFGMCASALARGPLYSWRSNPQASLKPYAQTSDGRAVQYIGGMCAALSSLCHRYTCISEI